MTLRITVPQGIQGFDRRCRFIVSTRLAGYGKLPVDPLPSFSSLPETELKVFWSVSGRRPEGECPETLNIHFTAVYTQL